ncbi:hypothetical protein CLU79DRAFT_859684 [Phycomyces nitens]|nr:hypothetical protein CLU79DRAFT_859684 [Phycomyces nitens]
MDPHFGPENNGPRKQARYESVDNITIKDNSSSPEISIENQENVSAITLLQIPVVESTDGTVIDIIEDVIMEDNNVKVFDTRDVELEETVSVKSVENTVNTVILIYGSCLQPRHKRSTHRNCHNNRNSLTRTEAATSPLNAARINGNPEPGRIDLGRMNIACPFCHSMMWLNERTSRSTITKPAFSMCCGSGRFILHPYEPTPTEMHSLPTRQTPRSKAFMEKIRNYNMALSFTSLGVKVDQSVANNNGGAYNFRISGSLHHKTGSLLPVKDSIPSFAQIYIHDTENEINHRQNTTG